MRIELLVKCKNDQYIRVELEGSAEELINKISVILRTMELNDQTKKG